MIEWLSNWLKEIILLVLIATFIDLLLPNNSMDRYVKLVMGLLIIMAILSPIFQILDKNIDLSSIALSSERGSEKQMDSLDHIKESGKGLKEEQEAYVHQKVEKTIEDTIVKGVRDHFPVEVLDVVTLVVTNAKKEPEIRKIDATVKMTTTVAKKKASSEDSGMKPIEPIKPVIVPSETMEEQNKRVVSDTKRIALIQRITQYLQKTWHLLPEQINVRLEH